MQHREPTMEPRPETGRGAPPGEKRPRWRLEGWIRELTDAEAGAVARIAIGVRMDVDLRAVDALAAECAELWPCAELPWMPERGWDPGCPGFCLLASEARWS